MARGQSVLSELLYDPGRAEPTGPSAKSHNCGTHRPGTRRSELETHKLGSAPCGPEPEGRHNWRLSGFCGHS